jgi:flavin-dependent dehydrogenase
VYDAIIIGARIAGSTLAMLLGDLGWRVLLLDRSRFPSDTLSTHAVFQDSFAIWKRLGVMHDIEAIGAAHMMRLRRNAGATIDGRFLPLAGHDYAMCLRRIKLDEVLVRNAAKRSTVELRTEAEVTELLWEDGRVVGVRGQRRGSNGERFEDRARVVVGADGRLSSMAKQVGAHYYSYVPEMNFAFYGYWRGVEPGPWAEPILDTFDSEPARATIMVMPADEDLWTLVVFATQDQLADFLPDHQGNYEARLRAEPMLAPRLRYAERISPVRGRGDFANFFRHSFGPGWALVGDAGSFKDAIAGQGIGDATRSCVILAEALDRAFKDEQPLEAALAWYQRERDLDLMPNYERLTMGAPAGVTRQEYQHFLVCVSHSQELSDQFVSVVGHAVEPEEFFAPENVRQVLQELGDVALRDESVLLHLGQLGR